jgi:hypothetical protein
MTGRAWPGRPIVAAWDLPDIMPGSQYADQSLLDQIVAQLKALGVATDFSVDSAI